MHLIIKPDLKASLDLLKYLKNPTVFEQVQSSRIYATILLFIKFFTGITTQTLFMVCLSKIIEGNFGTDPQNLHKMVSSSLICILNFVGFVVVYELPNIIFQLKMGSNEKQFMANVTNQGIFVLSSSHLNRKDPATSSFERNETADWVPHIIHNILENIYSIFYAYLWFYMPIIAQFLV